MHLLDRMLMRSYIKAYAICLISMLSLYVVVDMFMNLDSFSEHHQGLAPVLRHIGMYYGYRIVKIFDQLCEPIVLLAAMFTIAWMQRSNELLPLLSAGVSTRRVVRPVLVCSCCMLGLTVMNQELILPRIGDKLFYSREDPKGEKDLEVHSAREPNGIDISGQAASRSQQLVKRFNTLIPETIAGNLLSLTAKEAYYCPPGEGPHTGGWLLTGTTPVEPASREERKQWEHGGILEWLDVGKYFLHTSEIDFEAVTRNRKWFVNSSTLGLLNELHRPNATQLASMAVTFHMRLTRPILGMVLVLMGLSVILRDQNRNVFISAGLCLVLCAIFFGALFTCKNMGDTGLVSPALAAWLPVIFFGPVAFVLFDAIHT